ncbi:hypothetical protein EOD08_23790 [Mesorhizobium sp. M6A.T.Ca.TU.002.02.2.1]|nr:hypothetical protein EOD08_23790 [Mesorhizobium sp. M6A.T.Ca.TU.002.02.2.1]
MIHLLRMVRQKRLSLPFVPPFPEKDDPWKSFRPELNRHEQGKFEAQRTFASRKGPASFDLWKTERR